MSTDMKKEATESTLAVEPELEVPSADDAMNALLELVTAPPSAPTKIDGVVVGRLVALMPERLVLLNGAPEPRRARAMPALSEGHVGRDVAVMFEEGDPARPVILGVMEVRELPAGVALSDDGSTLHINAPTRIVLRCGEASITLTQEGKILLDGAYVSSKSTGVQRIVGASVEIN